MSQRDRLASLIHDAYRSMTSMESTPCEDDYWLADSLIAVGVRVVPDVERFDQDERDAEAEAHFLKPINPDPVTTFAKTNKVKR